MNSLKINLKHLSGILILSATAIAFLIWLIYFNSPMQYTSQYVTYLPALNATLNGLSALCLLLGLSAILKKNKAQHKKWMLTALTFSTLFLISYIIYHSLHGDTKFLGLGMIRPIYFFFLITHIILSISALPMILITVYFSLRGNFSSHKIIARVTWPIWMYVSVTGVLIFCLLKLYS